MTIRQILTGKLSSADLGDALVILLVLVVIVLYVTGVIR